jgi:hypothetical protein
MKKILLIIPLLAVFACTNSNTDTSVNKTDEPVKLSVEIDTMPPPLDTLMFSKVALDCFYHLGYSTDGEFYYKSAIESIHKVIIDVLNDHGSDGSDILFLIDKTGSMQNDIDSVRINLNLIIDQIERLKNVRLGVAAYGDKNVDGQDWFSSSPISSDYKFSREFINKLQVSDGGDYPESVYDGIAELIKQTSFRKDSKKMILVIGDAPSLEDSLSSYTRKSIIELCNKNGVKANLFPVLVTPFKAETFVEYSEQNDKIIEKVYPNPAKDVIKIALSKDGDYTVTLMDLAGRVIVSEKSNSKDIVVSIPNDTPNGNYVLRVLRNSDYQMNAEKIIISK